jgi:hypothetical protein
MLAQKLQGNPKNGEKNFANSNNEGVKQILLNFIYEEDFGVIFKRNFENPSWWSL